MRVVYMIYDTDFCYTPCLTWLYINISIQNFPSITALHEPSHNTFCLWRKLYKSQSFYSSETELMLKQFKHVNFSCLSYNYSKFQFWLWCQTPSPHSPPPHSSQFALKKKKIQKAMTQIYIQIRSSKVIVNINTLLTLYSIDTHFYVCCSRQHLKALQEQFLPLPQCFQCFPT